MKKVKVDLTYCFGIKRLEHAFDFSKTKAYAIYAPNGVMKSSFAETFHGAARKEPPKDRIFPARKSERKITDEAGAEIEGEDHLLVIHPYDDGVKPTEKTSTLLVEPKLRDEFAQLHLGANKAKITLLDAIKKQGDSDKDFEKEISSAVMPSDDRFVEAMFRLKSELAKQTETPFANVKYDVVFDDKVLKALDTKDLKNAIEEYIKRYNELLAASTYFRKGTFDYYNAAHIAKTLTDNGFFAAEHTITLNASGSKREVHTQKELEEIIVQEKEAILKDKDLRKKFDTVAKQLESNANVREFYRYIQQDEALLSRMNNVHQLREDVLKSYLKIHQNLYNDWIEKTEAAEKRSEEIKQEAKKQQTLWEQVINDFNDRFFVPFELEAKNRTQVMLGYAPIVELAFTYKDGNESALVEKADLLKVLSNGEKKALYILNVLFEIETRRKTGQETLVIVDDLADSFDYHNKYAIIEYLKDISEDGLFKLIIMTHNFDFFRTIESRFVGYSNCLMASKNDQGISLAKATGIRNIFANDWKQHFFTDSRKKIASIPFLRNLVEMSTGTTDPRYSQLTSMLHWKPDSVTITVAQLDTIYNSICNTTETSANGAKLVCELITEEANACLGATTGLNLENKIVLAIAIRMTSEKYMVSKINNPQLVAQIENNQTQELIKRFKELFSSEKIVLKILDRVALMTPENIHVNAFMYEPIVDMSDDHLKRLFNDVKTLA